MLGAHAQAFLETDFERWYYFQKPALANLATIMPDGTPQVTPGWVDFDGAHILVNTVKGRRKEQKYTRPFKSRP